MNLGEIVLRLLGVMVALGVVLFLAWLTLRFMNRKMPGMAGGSSRLIQVLDRVSTGRSSSLMLIRVQDTVMLVAFSEHTVQKLCEFDDPEGKMKLPEMTGAFTGSFASALKDAATRAGLKPKNDKGDEP